MKIIVCAKQIRHTYARTGTSPESHYICPDDGVYLPALFQGAISQKVHGRHSVAAGHQEEARAVCAGLGQREGPAQGAADPEGIAHGQLGDRGAKGADVGHGEGHGPGAGQAQGPLVHAWQPGHDELSRLGLQVPVEDQGVNPGVLGDDLHDVGHEGQAAGRSHRWATPRMSATDP